MLFKDALDALHAGKCLHRAAWKDEDGYLCLMQGMKHIWKIILMPAPNAGNYIFTVEDLLADDWQEYVIQDTTKAEVIPA